MRCAQKSLNWWSDNSSRSGWFRRLQGLPPFLRCFDSRQWHTCSSVYEFTTTLWFPGIRSVPFRLYHAHHEDLSAVATATTTATAYTKQFIWVMPLFLGFRAAFTSIDWTGNTLHLTKTTTIGKDITIHTFFIAVFHTLCKNKTPFLVCLFSYHFTVTFKDLDTSHVAWTFGCSWESSIWCMEILLIY